SGQAVKVHVPASFDLGAFQVGREVELHVTPLADGTFELTGSGDDESVKDAEQGDDDQGDMADANEGDHNRGDHGDQADDTSGDDHQGDTRGSGDGGSGDD